MNEAYLWTAGNITYVRFAVLIVFMSVISAYDIKYKKIPNAAVAAGSAAGILLFIIGGDIGIADTILGMLIVAIFGYYRLMGMGDIKYWMMLTLYMPIPYSSASVAAGGILLIMYGFLKNRRYLPKETYPFAPFISIGAVIVQCVRIAVGGI